MRGHRIRQRREDLGMTQQELADKLLVTVQAVSQWENGKTQPDSDRIPQLAKLLRTTADDLLDDAAPIAVSWQLSDRMFSEERMYSKLKAFAPAEGLEPVLWAFWDVLSILPGLACLGEMPGYEQGNPHHHLDLQGHTIQAVVSVPGKEALRLAALLHDSGKPACRTVDQQGVAHFYGHAKESARLAEEALRKLRCENALRRQVVELVELHDLWVPPTLPSARRWLGRLGEEGLRDLLALERGDTLAHAPACQPPRLARLAQWEALLDQVVEEGDCLSLRDLAVKGEDLLALGFAAGPELGATLRHLLEEVVEGRLENHREVLLAAARERLEEYHA